VYALELRYTTAAARGGFSGFYRYDRWLPTLLLTAEDTTSAGRLLDSRTTQLSLQASLPVRRTLRAEHDVSFAWRRRRETQRGTGALAPLDLGGLETAYSFTSARSYPYSISPVDGWRVRLSALSEAPQLGGDLRLTKLAADARGYLALGGAVLAARAGVGATIGQQDFRRSFSVGGFADDTLRDVARTNLSVLRGYPDDAFSGRSFLAANLELRLPLSHPQRGVRTLPVFLRHLHAAAFVDVGDAWTGSLRERDLKAGIGAHVGADLNVGHAVPLSVTAGVARGLSDRGETRFYLRTGLSF
jgi:outer membrane protein assembly factor BamA